jgi:peptidoglycan hydrolase CwlO-like protein
MSLFDRLFGERRQRIHLRDIVEENETLKKKTEAFEREFINATKALMDAEAFFGVKAMEADIEKMSRKIDRLEKENKTLRNSVSSYKGHVTRLRKSIGRE